MRALPLLALAAVACGTTPIQGTLVDGLGGAPLAGQRLLAKAMEPVGMTCQLFEATTGPDGSFQFDKPCLSQTGYRLEPDDETLFLADVDQVAKGAPGAGLQVKAWRAPGGTGLYELSNGTTTGIRTHADVKSETAYEGTTTIRYPATIPSEDDVVVIEPGEYVVVSGPGQLDKTEFVPLIQSGPRKFGNKTAWVDMEPWWYLGVEFTSDTEFTEKTAALDTARVVHLQKGDREAWIIPSDALPQGRYAVGAKDGRRISVIDFGASATGAGAVTTDSTPP